VKLPFDCWEVALTTWKLYFQTGAAEHKATLAIGGESMIPSLKRHMEIFDIKELSVAELFACNTKQAAYKAQMARLWASTAQTNASESPLDAMICPVHPSAGYPYVFSSLFGAILLEISDSYRHDFTCWWGYTSLFNILDYPSVTLPIKDLKISAENDPKDLTYKPLDNPFDKPTYDMCKSHHPISCEMKMDAQICAQMTQNFSRRSRCACKLWDSHTKTRN
jgi:amidase